MVSGPAITQPPTEEWCDEHAGEELMLTYEDETYIVAVQRHVDGDDGGGPPEDEDGSEDDDRWMFEPGDGGDAP